MNVKRIMRQMGAAFTGASMVGATIMGAAADLSLYPAPFVQDGILNALIVVGAEAKTSDTLGAIDIAASLQAASTSAVQVAGAAGRTTVSGDAVEFGEPSDMLEIEELIGDVKEVLTEAHLKALSSGTVTNDQGTTDYNQYLRFEENDGSIESCLVTFDENEDDEVGDYLFCKDGWTIFEYEMEFEEGLESDVKLVSSEFHLDDLEDETLNLFGTEYSIVNAIVNGTSTGANFSIKLEMLGGNVVDTLGEGETRTYTVDGVDYEVTAIFISDGGASDEESAKFSVNGDITDELADGETDVLPGGMQIGVREILTNQREGIVEFFLGANKVELTDAGCNDDDQFHTGGVEIGNENIEDARVKIKCGYVSGSADGVTAGDTIEITDLKYQLDADASGGGVYVPPGHGVREFLDEPQGMLNPTWDIRYEGLLDTGTSDLVFNPSGDDEYRLTFTSREGYEYDIPLATNEGGTFKFGDEDDDLIFMEHCGGMGHSATAAGFFNSTCFNVHEDDYFVLTDDNDETGFTHVLRYESIDTSNNVITFNDLATGNKEVTYTGDEATGNATGTIVVGGKSYSIRVWNKDSQNNLAIDLDNSGAFTIGNEANIVIEGGGILDLGSMENDTGAIIGGSGNYTNGTIWSQNMTKMNLTTLAAEFDESGANNTGVPEEINISVTSRTGNEVGLSAPSPSQSGRRFYNFKSLRSNNDVDQALTTYGVFMELFDESGTDEAEQLTIKYPLSQRGVQVFVTAGTIRTSKAGGPGGAVMVNPAAVGIGVLDSDVTLGRGNLIVVGGPCVNTIAAELMDNPTDCAEGFTPGKATVKLYDDKNALLVAGYSAQDTLGAAYVLADYEDYDLAGMEVEVVVADLDSITVNKVA